MPINYSKYPPDWKTEIRPRIMARAGNRCEVEGCGLKHLEYVWSVRLFERDRQVWIRDHDEAIQRAVDSGWECDVSDPIVRQVKVVLTIAHLDHDETNWDVKDDRLMAMCQIHHLRYDANEKYRRAKEKSGK